MIDFFAKQLLACLHNFSVPGMANPNATGRCFCFTKQSFLGDEGETWREATAERELLGCLPLREIDVDLADCK